MDTTHTRIYKKSLQNLRRIYAETGESMVGILDRLIASELERIRNANVQIQALPEREESNTGKQD